MSSVHGPDHSDLVLLLVLRVGSTADAERLAAELSECADCRREIEMLEPVVAAFGAWPTDVLQPPDSAWDRLASRISTERDDRPAAAPPPTWSEPEWREVSAGIRVKLLATDADRNRVSMLVRLDPGVEYPPHRHAEGEELHLLDGELVIDDKTLQPGDYYSAPSGSNDRRVWSQTGCTCVLITSPGDLLG